MLPFRQENGFSFLLFLLHLLTIVNRGSSSFLCFVSRPEGNFTVWKLCKLALPSSHGSAVFGPLLLSVIAKVGCRKFRSSTSPTAPQQSTTNLFPVFVLLREKNESRSNFE